MLKKYQLYLLFVALLSFTVACDLFQQQSMNSIQFQIMDTNLSVDEKNKAITNLQRRLESIGAQNVVVAAQEDQKVTFHYRGTFKPPTFENSFSVAGKLEFMEVCKEKEVLLEYLLKTSRNEAAAEDLLTTEAPEQIEDPLELFGINVTNKPFDFVFAYVPKKNKGQVEKTLLEKGSFFVSKLKKRVKFLLSKDVNNDMYELYAVYVSKDDKAPVDGSCVIDATVERASYDDSYVVTIQMDDEGAKLWEQLTQYIFETRGNIAIVVDDKVYAAPTVTAGAISGGVSQISAHLTKKEAGILATAVRSGNIPKVEILQTTIIKETF